MHWDVTTNTSDCLDLQLILFFFLSLHSSCVTLDESHNLSVPVSSAIEELSGD